jgi:hypothetical protein
MISEEIGLSGVGTHVSWRAANRNICTPVFERILVEYPATASISRKKIQKSARKFNI